MFVDCFISCKNSVVNITDSTHHFPIDTKDFLHVEDLSSACREADLSSHVAQAPAKI
jgi:hypothetical protein